MKQKTSENEGAKFRCKICDKTCRDKYNFKRHLSTTRHKMKQNETENERKRVINKTPLHYDCEMCSKTFKSRTTLWRHKKKCKMMNENVVVKEESGDLNEKMLFEFIQKQTEQQNKLMESVVKLAEQQANNITNTNCNNTNNISINLFLNEECKNAMNLTDFVNNVKLSLEDIKYTTEHGYVKGISNILVKNLTDIDPRDRPIHCSDTKRLQFYVKDEDSWAKDENNTKIDQSIDNITRKQIACMKEWTTANPDYLDNERKMEEYMIMVRRLMGGNNIEEQTKNKNRIIRQVSEEVQVKEAINKG